MTPSALIRHAGAFADACRRADPPSSTAECDRVDAAFDDVLAAMVAAGRYCPERFDRLGVCRDCGNYLVPAAGWSDGCFPKPVAAAVFYGRRMPRACRRRLLYRIRHWGRR